MKSTRIACSFLLLTMAAVCSGRNATEYFQQARFQHRPSRPEDAVVFFTANAPPLMCELEMVGDWTGGHRLKADLILEMLRASMYYTCSFEGNATTRTNLQLIQKGLPDVFISRGEQKIEFSDSQIECSNDSQLPDEYFQLQIQRPYEEGTVKCRDRRLNKELYLRFPGYPTIICPLFSNNAFMLPGIVGDQLRCAFQVYADLRTDDKQTEQRLFKSLVSRLPSRIDGRLPNIVCSIHARPNGTAHFQVRLPGDTIYDCRFSDD